MDGMVFGILELPGSLGGDCEGGKAEGCFEAYGERSAPNFVMAAPWLHPPASFETQACGLLLRMTPLGGLR